VAEAKSDGDADNHRERKEKRDEHKDGGETRREEKGV
jgi:hypothetical protein